MTEYDGTWKEELASQFIVSTCQLVPKLFSSISDHIDDFIGSAETQDNVYTESPFKEYSLICGSFAEFYIRPLIPCISDADFLTCKADYLAFSDDFPVLPTDMSGMSDKIVWVKIVPYQEYPGFVRVQHLGAIHYNWKYKEYEFKETRLGPLKYYLTVPKISRNWHTPVLPMDISECNRSFRTGNHGPAIVLCNLDKMVAFGTDDVASIWCPQWPTEAQDWPLRPRHCGWPKTGTISEVLQNGCHVVFAQHRSFRNDQFQWRLSFSIAEVILIQSWSVVQQIVYHMLRFFAKKELIEKDCPKEVEVLCPYHLKTLMLWTCEEKSKEWWNSSSVISICCKLLKKLSEWLKRKHCPNYFIPDANLFYEPLNQTMYNKCNTKLRKFCQPSILSYWFLENYIEPFTREHFEVDAYANGIKNQQLYVDYMQTLLQSRKSRVSDSFNLVLCFRLAISQQTCRPIFKQGFCSGLRQPAMLAGYMKLLDAKTSTAMSTLLATENFSCFTYFDNLLYILHAAFGIGFGEVSWESNLFVELIKAISMQPNILKSKYHDFPKTYTERSSRFQYLLAHNLMQLLTGTNSNSEFQLLCLLSKEFLKRALECDDYESSCIAPAALSYLSALHFASSEYQQAMRCCSVVLSNHAPQKNKETLNAGCLLFIDDVARIVGLYILQKRITDINLHYIRNRLFLDLRLTTEVFAYYVFKLLSERNTNYFDFHNDSPDSVFALDECLEVSLKHRFIVSKPSSTRLSVTRQRVYCRKKTEIADANTFLVKETVIDMLMKYALENMTLSCGLFQNDFGMECNTIDCYRALYLYKCHQYDETLRLCDQILREPDVKNNLKQLALADVLLFPPLDAFFDEDVQSLLGLHTLFYFLSPHNDEQRKLGRTSETTFAHWFGNNVHICQPRRELSPSIIIQDSAKCYFLGRHFVAKYLKARCCIDYDLPSTEALTEFAAQKSRFPFEYIIRSYFRQRLCIVRK